LKKIKSILRDAVLIFLLTGLGGFVIGFIGSIANSIQPNTITSNKAMELVGISNLLLSIIGLTISGYKIKENVADHLAYVGLAIWIMSLINIIIGKINLIQWLTSILVVIFCCLISYVFVRILLKLKRNKKGNKDRSFNELYTENDSLFE